MSFGSHLYLSGFELRKHARRGLAIRQRLTSFEGLKLVKDKDPSNYIEKFFLAFITSWLKKQRAHGN